MKHLFISLFLSGSLFSAFAQNDSLSKAPVIRDSTPVTTNSTMNNVRTDSTGSVNNLMKSDSTSSMNNTIRNDSTGSVNNNSNINSTTTTNTQSNVNSSASNSDQMHPAFPSTINNSQNIVGQPGYASLPILESYVPADVVDKVKSKHNSVYDISSVKHTADQKAYFVRYLDNGVYKTEIIGEDGNVIQ